MIKNVLILYTQKTKILAFIPELENKLKYYGIFFYSFIVHPSELFQDSSKKKIEELLPSIDMVFCLGGDGTVLSAAQILYKWNIPILPINFGQLGFIAEETEPETIDTILSDLVNKSYIMEQRTLLDIFLCDKSEQWIGLNEAYIGSNHAHKVGNFSITINDHMVSQYKTDGILLSTATGSTGYNLSAGGPILHPSLDVFVLTSVIPHKISHRPLVIPSSSEVKITLANDFSQNLIIDGQYKSTILPNHCITIKKSLHNISLIYSQRRNYFLSLKEKLNWMV